MARDGGREGRRGEGSGGALGGKGWEVGETWTHFVWTRAARRESLRHAANK